jgi:hypothetical protein
MSLKHQDCVSNIHMADKIPLTSEAHNNLYCKQVHCTVKFEALYTVHLVVNGRRVERYWNKTYRARCKGTVQPVLVCTR